MLYICSLKTSKFKLYKQENNTKVVLFRRKNHRFTSEKQICSSLHFTNELESVTEGSCGSVATDLQRLIEFMRSQPTKPTF